MEPSTHPVDAHPMSPKCPVAGCTIAVDIALRSSDGALIGAHKPNLDLYSERFPFPCHSMDHGDGAAFQPPQVEMESESSSVLALLLSFMHRQQFPDVGDLGAAELFGLAYAAEKYSVHAAMAGCCTAIMLRVKEFPVDALAYSVKWNYSKIVDLAAPLAGCYTTSEVKEKLLQAPPAFDTWLEYKMTTMERIEDLLFHGKYRSDAVPHCEKWKVFRDTLTSNLGESSWTRLWMVFDRTLSGATEQAKRIASAASCNKACGNLFLASSSKKQVCEEATQLIAAFQMDLKTALDSCASFTSLLATRRPLSSV